VRAPSLCEDIDRGENEVDQPLNDSTTPDMSAAKAL